MITETIGDRSVVKKILLSLIRFYKKNISPVLGNNCRFTPTCSEYAYEAIDTRGVFIGLLLSLWRFLRCNPLNRRYGYDPVPKRRAES
ncbi:MAG: membrane protein insertion efficiency factor YidD [Ruminococcaceae bacterium]|nr:membrane protein insertion efficiency factor YidD [Oscillospiraceae bacterium]